MKIVSCFDGIACGRAALDNLGITPDVYFASEIERHPINITKHNWPDIVHLGDITKIDFSHDKFKDTDVMWGGSPCTNLSVAGKREGLVGDQSRLFFDFVDAIKTVQPRYFLLENVASMKKEWKDIISNELWGIEPIMINAALVTAQNRKRLFWVGKRQPDGSYAQLVVSQPEDRGVLLRDIIESGAVDKDKSLCITAHIAKDNEKHTGSKSSVRAFTNGVIEGAAMRNRGEGKKPEFNGTEKANALTSVQTDSCVVLGWESA